MSHLPRRAASPSSAPRPSIMNTAPAWQAAGASASVPAARACLTPHRAPTGRSEAAAAGAGRERPGPSCFADRRTAGSADGFRKKRKPAGKSCPWVATANVPQAAPARHPHRERGTPGGQASLGRGLGCCGVCAGSWAAPGGLRWPRAPKVTAAILLHSVLLATFGSDLAPTGQPGLFIKPKSGLGFRGTSVSLAQACGSGPCGLFSAETWARGGGLRGPHPFQ